MKFVNIRGCNGSGKTTLLRFLARHPDCRVENVQVFYEYKNKHDIPLPPKVFICPKTRRTMIPHSPIPVTYVPGNIAILGDYTRASAGSTTAGCDRIKTQEATKMALELIAQDESIKAILFEGIVISTIYEPWKEWARRNGGMVWAFLDTPLELCLSRIQERNGGKPVKEDQIADKHRTISRVLEKAYGDGERIANIRWDHALRDIKTVIQEVVSGNYGYVQDGN